MKYKKYKTVRNMVLFGLSAALLFSPRIHAEFIYQDIYVPGSLQTRAMDINNLGTIVGYYQIGSVNQAFLLINGQYSAIPLNEAYRINDAGDVVGSIGLQSFIYSGGVLTPIDFPGASHTRIEGINNSGTIVGQYSNGGDGYKAFSYSNGVYSTLDLPDLGRSAATSINDAGTIVGYIGSVGFMVRDGVFSSIEYRFEGSTGRTYASDINNSDQIVGFGPGPGVTDRGYFYDQEAFFPLDYERRIQQTQVYGLNDDGLVVGLWWDFGNNVGHGFLATPTDQEALPQSFEEIPEPSSLALLMLGLIGLGTVRVKRVMAANFARQWEWRLGIAQL